MRQREYYREYAARGRAAAQHGQNRADYRDGEPEQNGAGGGDVEKGVAFFEQFDRRRGEIKDEHGDKRYYEKRVQAADVSDGREQRGPYVYYARRPQRIVGAVVAIERIAGQPNGIGYHDKKQRERGQRSRYYQLAAFRFEKRFCFFDKARVRHLRYLLKRAYAIILPSTRFVNTVL